ncbi:MAG: hypothetical protein RL701_7392 [Pseudomonadota bacterium]
MAELSRAFQRKQANLAARRQELQRQRAEIDAAPPLKREAAEARWKEEMKGLQATSASHDKELKEQEERTLEPIRDEAREKALSIARRMNAAVLYDKSSYCGLDSPRDERAMCVAWAQIDPTTDAQCAKEIQSVSPPEADAGNVT